MRMSGHGVDTVARVERDPAEDLVGMLAQAVTILERMGEEHWAAWLRSDLAHLQRGEMYRLDHLLHAFGGMGSINDVMVDPANGHPVDADGAAAVNAELRALLSGIHTAATNLR